MPTYSKSKPYIELHFALQDKQHSTIYICYFYVICNKTELFLSTTGAMTDILWEGASWLVRHDCTTCTELIDCEGMKGEVDLGGIWKNKCSLDVW